MGAASGGSPGSSVLNVADAAIAGNDPGMALKVSQSVLSTDPTNLDALYHEGQAYYAVDRCMDAIAAYKVALSIKPNSSEAQTGIGRCLLKRNAAEAELAFTAAVQDDPSNAAALNDLGIARDLQGKYAAATHPYEQALLITPGTLSTEVNLGLSLALSGDAGDALQYLGPLATGAEATPKIRENYAAALVAAGRMDEAKQVLSIDLPPEQAASLLDIYSNIIAQSQQSAAAATAAPSPAVAPSNPIVTVTPVASTAIASSAAVSASAADSNAVAPVIAPQASPADPASIVTAMQAPPSPPRPVLPAALAPAVPDSTGSDLMVR